MNVIRGWRIAAALLSVSVSDLAAGGASAHERTAVQTEVHVVVHLPAVDVAARGNALQETIAVYRRRLDPAGKRHVRIEAQGRIGS
jgi:hypothetical protein